MENDGILSDRGKKIVNFIIPNRSVGGQIHGKNYHLWEDYKIRCYEYKVKMNTDGMEHILRLCNKIDNVFFPIAKSAGIEPAKFTEDRIDKLLESVKKNKDWIKETDQLHDDIINKTDENLVYELKGGIK